jgi:REP element-mobilizing transposase RayT
MRVEPYSVGSFVHVTKRGARGLPITRDSKDKIRFARLLYHVNDEYKDENWDRRTSSRDIFKRPTWWPERRPLCRVHCWTLMPNHFHLLLEEIQDGGVAKYMQRVCGSMSTHFNAKYEEKGSLFQGAYKGRTVSDDSYLRQVIPYIVVKNVFELYQGGLERAVGEFQNAWEWGVRHYTYSNLPELGGVRDWPVTERGIVQELFPSPDALKRQAKEMLLSRKELRDTLSTLYEDDG